MSPFPSYLYFKRSFLMYYYPYFVCCFNFIFSWTMQPPSCHMDAAVKAAPLFSAQTNHTAFALDAHTRQWRASCTSEKGGGLSPMEQALHSTWPKLKGKVYFAFLNCSKSLFFLPQLQIWVLSLPNYQNRLFYLSRWFYKWLLYFFHRFFLLSFFFTQLRY